MHTALKFARCVDHGGLDQCGSCVRVERPIIDLMNICRPTVKHRNQNSTTTFCDQPHKCAQPKVIIVIIKLKLWLAAGCEAKLQPN